MHGRVVVVDHGPIGDEEAQAPQANSLSELYLLDRGPVSLVLGKFDSAVTGNIFR